MESSVQIMAMLPTHHLPEAAMPWMAEARKVFGGLVILIDENRATAGTESRAKSVATRVHLHPADTWYENDRAAMARACESDWVFVIDYDEQLSPEWQQDSWRQIRQTTEFTHFWCPRRWVVPGWAVRHVVSVVAGLATQASAQSHHGHHVSHRVAQQDSCAWARRSISASGVVSPQPDPVVACSARGQGPAL